MSNSPLVEIRVSLDQSYQEAREIVVSAFERAYLRHHLSQTSLNLSAASRATGVSRKHLRSLMHKHEMAVQRRLGRLAVGTQSERALPHQD